MQQAIILEKKVADVEAAAKRKQQLMLLRKRLQRHLEEEQGHKATVAELVQAKLAHRREISLLKKAVRAGGAVPSLTQAAVEATCHSESLFCAHSN